MSNFIVAADLTPFATIETTKAEAMIADAEAQAMLAAPCLAAAAMTAGQTAIVKAILRGVLLRWNEAGVGGSVTQQTAGPFSQTLDTRDTGRRALFWPSEIEQLQKLCSIINGTSVAKGFSLSYDMGAVSDHLPWCDVMFGALTCSCGVTLTGYYPIYEL